MDEAASQTNDESKSGKKIKSCRPIILLRRNSCNITLNNTSTTCKVSQASQPKTVCGVNKNTTQPSADVKPSKSNISLHAINTSNSIPVVKTEVLENSVVPPWNVASKGSSLKNTEIVVPSKISLNSAMNENKVKLHQTFGLPGAQLVPIPQKPLMQSNSLNLPQAVPINNISANIPVFANPQFQAVNQIAIPLNNATVNPMIRFGNEQFSGPANFQSGRYFCSSIVHNSVNPLQVPLQDNNRPIVFHPNRLQGLVSEGPILQTYSNPTYHYQTASLQPDPMPHASASHSQLDSIADDSLTNITWLGKMGVNNFMPVPLEKEKKVVELNDKRGRPPYSYMALIQFAINSSATGRMTLRQIYEWIEEKFPYFRTAKPGWKNSIRHNLSLHDLFVREVTNGSKASYWTLRPDLNVRSLTLDNVDSSTSPNPIWSLQSVGQNQKPLLPRLPFCSRPYILLPVPLLQNLKDSTANISSKVHTVESSVSTSQDGSSSLFVDSGLHSDTSYCTPSVGSKNFSLFSESAINLHNDSDGVLLKTDKNSDDYCPFLSQATSSEKSSKRSRKEPLKTLNDSLNSSLHFDKDDLTSPPRHQLKTFLRREDNDSSKPMTVGLSEESFTELLNDLGSPFKSYLTQESSKNRISSPKGDYTRKRRRSWGSPDSSGSGLTFQRELKAANERTPRQNMRRVKSDLVDLTKEQNLLPTSTPLMKEKLKKSSNQNRFQNWNNFENKENITPTKSFLSSSSNWRNDPNSHITNPIFAPSPILNPHCDADFESNFFEDIIGSVFKTPDKPSAPVRHFDSLTPTRPSFTVTTPPSRAQATTSRSDDEIPMLIGVSPTKEDPLNTSFSKLLDISGSSTCFGRLPSNYPDLDLNLSWSNLPNV